MDVPSINTVLQDLATNKAVQTAAIGAVGIGLHKIFSLLDATKTSDQLKTMLHIAFVFLTLLANLADAWSKGQAGFVDVTQWTQFLVMIFAVVGFHDKVAEPAAHKVSLVLRSRRR